MLFHLYNLTKPLRAGWFNRNKYQDSKTLQGVLFRPDSLPSDTDDHKTGIS